MILVLFFRWFAVPAIDPRKSFKFNWCVGRCMKRTKKRYLQRNLSASEDLIANSQATRDRAQTPWRADVATGARMD
jgi:hypothetical protein